MVILMEAGWLQSSVVTPDSINSLTATWGRTRLQLTDPEDPRDSEGEETGRLAYLGKTKRGSQFSSVQLVHRLGRVLEAEEARG